MVKDSLEMTDHDRVLLLGMVRAILNENASMVITHGTDTIVQSGLFLERSLPDLHVPIVMTGAMTPLGFEGSDGLQNLTESLFAIRLLKAGIYVVMPALSHRERPQGHDTIPLCLVRRRIVLSERRQLFALAQA
jgi:L-asparaginase